MSQCTQLLEQIKLLNELSAVMRAMKNMALAESRKLARRSVHTDEALDTIEYALADVLTWHAGRAMSQATGAGVTLVAIGAERGFCGNFNQIVAQSVAGRRSAAAASNERTVVVGARLAALLNAQGLPSSQTVTGASSVEEVPHVVQRLVDAILGDDGSQGELGRVVILGHWPGSEGAIARTLFPPQLPADIAPAASYPARTYLPWETLVSQLLEQWLWEALHAALYNSLAVEIRQRLMHVDSAMRRSEDRAADLRTRYNVVRQEEITQEIEVIMLASELVRGRRMIPAAGGNPSAANHAGILSRQAPG